jgi:hypothetical protein
VWLGRDQGAPSVRGDPGPPSSPGRAARDRPGITFLLEHDLATSDFPTDTTISRDWTKLGFPSAYVADSLQGLEALVELGHGRDRRLSPTLDMVLAKQDAHGRWRNEHPYRGRLWAEVDAPGRPSKWVTLRACRVLKWALG